MAIDFSCNQCGRTLRVPDGSEGKHCRCPGCEELLAIPGTVAKSTAATIEVACPRCAHVLVCDASLEGTRGMCRNCQFIFTISRNASKVSRGSDESIPFECPSCKHLFEGKPEAIGRKGKCPGCGSVFVIQKFEKPPADMAGSAANQRPAQAQPKTSSNNPQKSVPPKSIPAKSDSSTSGRTRAGTAASGSENPTSSANKSIWDDLLPELPPVTAANQTMPPSMPNPFGGAMSSYSTNPYAAPTSSGYDVPIAESGSETIRKMHIGHEASIKSFGCLYALGAIFLVLAGIVVIIAGIGQIVSPNPNQPATTGLLLLALSAVYLGLGIAQGFVAWGLRKLNQVGRIGGTFFGAIGLLGIPIGTLISAYLLYLLWSEKGNTVFSPRYKRVIRATPHIKYKTSIIVWIFLGVIVIVFGLLFVIAMTATRRN